MCISCCRTGDAVPFSLFSVSDWISFAMHGWAEFGYVLWFCTSPLPHISLIFVSFVLQRAEAWLELERRLGARRIAAVPSRTAAIVVTGYGWVDFYCLWVCVFLGNFFLICFSSFDGIIRDMDLDSSSFLILSIFNTFHPTICAS